MAQIAFILLAHKDPAGVITQAERLTAAGDAVAIHFDARSKREDFTRIREALAGNPAVALVRRRVACGWGEWSLVKATLRTVTTALAAFPGATHFYLLSGDCLPIKSADYAHAFLDRADRDHLESVDFFTSGWIRTGLREERLTCRHFVNERKQRWLFYALLDLQKKLGLVRRIPDDLQIQIGSQWWCLRRSTIEAVLDFIAGRPDVVRFFRRTWIPDEIFFQTLVRHLVPGAEIDSRTLTFLMFSDYGLPVTFHNDHHDLLLRQDYLFARKISPEAKELKARLGALYAVGGAHFPTSNEGRSLYHFLTSRGRSGRRFAPRAWEVAATLGRGRTLMIVTCKKWQVAKQLTARMGEVTGIPATGYLFNEEATPLPDLGGIQTTLAKRSRHRRALVRMLFDYWQTDQMILCVDPASLDLMQDFQSDCSKTRVLEIDCEFTEAYLASHARRLGVAGADTPPETLARLLPAIREDLRVESERLSDAGFDGFFRIRQSASADENAVPIATFLDIPPAKALEIAATDHLFAD